MKLLSSFFFFFCITNLFAQSNKNFSVLFLGNSYTDVNNLPLLIHNIALANGDTLFYDSNCPGGYTLNGHYTNATSISKINAQKWDFVVVQAQSQEPSFPPSQVAMQTLPYAIMLDSLIQLNDSCTNTVFFETWGRKYGDAANCAFYPPLCTYIGMQDRLKSSYKLFADTCHALMSPVGEAWRKSIAIDSTLNLYQADQSHPSIEGSYLAACVFYEILFGKSVLNNSFTAGISPITSTSLQQIAHDVINDSSLVWNIGLFPPCSPSAGIGDLDIKNNQPNIYPNPTNDVLFIKLPIDVDSKIYAYQIIDVYGNVHQISNLQNNAIDVSQLLDGVYFITLISEDENNSFKFIKQKK